VSNVGNKYWREQPTHTHTFFAFQISVLPLHEVARQPPLYHLLSRLHTQTNTLSLSVSNIYSSSQLVSVAWQLQHQEDPSGAPTLLLLPRRGSCTSLAGDPLPGGTLNPILLTGWGLSLIEKDVHVFQ